MSADIEAIKADAEAIAADVVTASQPAAALPVVDPVAVLADEVAGIVTAVVAALSPMLPSLQGIYTDATTRAAASAIAAVCVKRGWLAGGIFGEWKEEISAAMILIPLGMATYQGVMADLNRKPQEKVVSEADVQAGAN